MPTPQNYDELGTPGSLKDSLQESLHDLKPLFSYSTRPPDSYLNRHNI